MALSAQQMSDIRYYTGYSYNEDNGPLQRALDGLSSRPEAEPRIVADLDELAAIDAQIRKVRVIAMATQDGAVQTRGAYSLSVIRSMGRQLVGRLASFLEVPIKRDMFGPGAPGMPSSDPFGPDRDYVPSASGGCG